MDKQERFKPPEEMIVDSFRSRDYDSACRQKKDLIHSGRYISIGTIIMLSEVDYRIFAARRKHVLETTSKDHQGVRDHGHQSGFPVSDAPGRNLCERDRTVDPGQRHQSPCSRTVQAGNVRPATSERIHIQRGMKEVSSMWNDKNETPKMKQLRAEGKKSGNMSKYNAYKKRFEASIAWHKAHSAAKPVTKKATKVAKKSGSKK